MLYARVCVRIENIKLVCSLIENAGDNVKTKYIYDTLIVYKYIFAWAIGYLIH